MRCCKASKASNKCQCASIQLQKASEPRCIGSRELGSSGTSPIFILLYVCPHTTICVSAYYDMCVLMLLCVCHYATMCVLILLCVCPHTTMSVSLCYCVCVLML